MVLGDNGLIDKSKTAIGKYGDEANSELELYDFIGNLINKEYELLDSRNNSDCNHISNKISEFTPLIENVGPKSFTIKVPEQIRETSIGYVYIVDGKVKGVSENTSFTVNNLEANKNYTCNIMAIDIDSKIKYSASKDQLTTSSFNIISNGAIMYDLGVDYSTCSNINITSGDNYISFISTNSEGYGSSIYSTQKIDLSQYSSLKVSYSLLTSSARENSVFVGYGDSLTTSSYYTERNGTNPGRKVNDGAWTGSQSTNLTDYNVLTVNISNVTQSKHVGIITSGSVKIYNLWLE